MENVINIQVNEYKSELILNFMFSGDYLDKNIGHEIINLYTSDGANGKEGEQYVYLCQDGLFNPKEHPNIERIIFVRRTGNSGEMEIIGFTDGKLKYIQPQYIKSEATCQKAIDAKEVKEIRYGGVSIQDIFKHNHEQQSINVTFKAERVLRPKESLYIHLNENNIDNKKIFNASRNLRTYIQSDKDYTCYQYLKQKIKIVTPLNSKIIKSIDKDEVSIPIPSTEIYGIQNYELAYSNALKFFIDTYPQEFKEFFFQVTGNINLGEYVQTYREWKNIDIIVEYQNAVIVIENKILSGLNGICKDQKFEYNQLDKYQEIILRNKKETKEEKAINDGISVLNKKYKYFLLLSPDHNDIPLTERHKSWEKIFYSTIFNFFNGRVKGGNYEKEFTDFLRSISNHCDKDYQYTIMRKRFIRAIAKAKSER